MSRLFFKINPIFKGFSIRVYSVLFYLLSVSVVAIADDKLIHDPFEKPGILMPVLPSRASGSSSINNFVANTDLTATLQAGSNSMVIVDGRMIGLDDEIDGYRLVKVLERSAVFIKNKQRVILKIDKVDETN